MYIYSNVFQRVHPTSAMDKATGAGYLAWQREFSPWQHVRQPEYIMVDLHP